MRPQLKTRSDDLLLNLLQVLLQICNRAAFRLAGHLVRSGIFTNDSQLVPMRQDQVSDRFRG